MRVQLCHRQSGRKVHWSMSTDCVHGLAARLPGGAHGSVLKNLPPPKKNKMFSLASFLDLPNHPVFDHLQYAKMEGGGRLGPFYHVNDLPRGGGGLQR